jgi:hypothetical protein
MLGKIRLVANKVTQSYLYKIITIIEEKDSPRHKKSYVEEERAGYNGLLLHKASSFHVTGLHLFPLT